MLVFNASVVEERKKGEIDAQISNANLENKSLTPHLELARNYVKLICDGLISQIYRSPVY